MKKKNNITNKTYDYIVVGAGLCGCTAAYVLKSQGYDVLVIEKRNHIGGNCFCENINNIVVHKYGAHIFHTNNYEAWKLMNNMAKMKHYNHYVIANNNGKLYNLPFNMNTFIQLWDDITTPQEALNKINCQCIKKDNYDNLEDWVLGNVGTDIYETLIKNYTEKQWQRNCKDLSADIIKRLPLRMNFNNNYFNDKYQGVPINGYNELFENLLDGIDVKLNCDYFDDREHYNNVSKKGIIYTGQIDKYFNYCFGKLQYRSLKFDDEILNVTNYQGCPVMNYTDNNHAFTRIIEHKHFICQTDEELNNINSTIITREYPEEYNGTNEPYYPVFTNENIEMYNKYKKLADKEFKVLFIGRLAEYKYYDMDDTIINVFNKLK